MVHVYYHIYAIEGIESIIDEQIQSIRKEFNFPYKLNIGVSIANEYISSRPLIEKIYNYNNPNYKIVDIRCKGNEFVTLDLILNDRQHFSDSDYVFYFHTKGASKQHEGFYNNIVSWRKMMQYFLIEKNKNIFTVLGNTNYNTYGVLLNKVGNWKLHYSGNFWWSKASYIKTINLEGVKINRTAAEINFIQNGKDWQPYSPYDKQGENHYSIEFKREEYAK